MFIRRCAIWRESPIRRGWKESRYCRSIRGEAKEINEEVFAEVTYHAAYEPKRAVRTGRWKYIRRYGDKHTPVLPNCDDGLSKNLWLEYGWGKMRFRKKASMI